MILSFLAHIKPISQCHKLYLQIISDPQAFFPTFTAYTLIQATATIFCLNYSCYPCPSAAYPPPTVRWIRSHDSSAQYPPLAPHLINQAPHSLGPFPLSQTLSHTTFPSALARVASFPFVETPGMFPHQGQLQFWQPGTLFDHNGLFPNFL